MRPVEPVAGQEPHLATVEPGMHAEAVVFDFMQPLVAVRRRLTSCVSCGRIHCGRAAAPLPGRRATGRVMPETKSDYCAGACASSK